jgi:hypothetical protein
VNGYQQTAACPRCGSTAEVHAIQELAALARMQLGESPQPYPGAQPGGLPGYMQEPTTGPIPDPYGYPSGGGYHPNLSSGPDYLSPGDQLAGLAMSEAAKFIGRRIGRRAQRAADRVQPPRATQNTEVLRTQIAIADKYPDLRACFTDSVIFLAGGYRVLPMPDLSALTMQQADDLVATLRAG